MKGTRHVPTWKKAEKVMLLMDQVPNGVIHDADTILKDLMDEADFEITGLAFEIIRTWQDSDDPSSVGALFHTLTGCKFEDWLDRCLADTTRSTQDRIKKAEQVLADNGIEPDECQTVLQALGYVLLDEELYPDERDEK